MLYSLRSWGSRTTKACYIFGRPVIQGYPIGKLVTRDVREPTEIAKLEDAFAATLGLCSMTDLDIDAFSSPYWAHYKPWGWYSGRNNGWRPRALCLFHFASLQTRWVRQRNWAAVVRMCPERADLRRPTPPFTWICQIIQCSPVSLVMRIT
jgi:hypothetical protein